MFFARWAIAVLCILASARLIPIFEPPLPGRAARRRVLLIESAVVSFRTVRPTNMFVSGQKGFLHRILCVSYIPGSRKA
jgi:hypothetical protein